MGEKILIIKTGGTIASIPDESGALSHNIKVQNTNLY